MTINEQLCIGWGLVVGAITRGVIMKTLVARIVAWFGGDIMQKIVKCIPQIVKEAEKAMQDGKIDAAERKALAVATVQIVADQFGIKLSGIMKWVVSVIIDNIAKKLPARDIEIPDIIKQAIGA